MPLFLLAGGEIVLGLLALRVSLWVAAGWREYRRSERAARRPGGPDGGSVLPFPRARAAGRVAPPRLAA